MRKIQTKFERTTKSALREHGFNFVRAEAKLSTQIDNWSIKTINDKMREYHIEWNFNPSECSHRGGLWEGMIRSTRRILRSISNDQVLDDETLCT